jgi:hypothetical protein
METYSTSASYCGSMQSTIASATSSAIRIALSGRAYSAHNPPIPSPPGNGESPILHPPTPSGETGRIRMMLAYGLSNCTVPEMLRLSGDFPRSVNVNTCGPLSGVAIGLMTPSKSAMLSKLNRNAIRKSEQNCGECSLIIASANLSSATKSFARIAACNFRSSRLTIHDGWRLALVFIAQILRLTGPYVYEINN